MPGSGSTGKDFFTVSLLGNQMGVACCCATTNMSENI